MAEKPMTFHQWAEETIGAQVAAADAVDDLDDWDEFLERVGSVVTDEEVQAFGRRMIAAYYAYICSFIDALKVG